MGDPYADDVELISMHSTSKGIIGECGLRGGYMEAHNLDPYALDMLFKLKSIELCSNTVGQIATNLMVDPPRRGREDDQTVDKYERQYTEVYNGLCDRANLLTSTFNSMQNVSCNTIEGAMYGFPKVEFHEKALARAKK
jgi:alanine transaminase